VRSERQAVPSVCLVAASGSDLRLPRRLLDQADVSFATQTFGSRESDLLSVPETLAGYALIIAFVEGHRLPAVVSAVIGTASKLATPVLLLAARRDITEEWPAALHELPVIFADGDPSAVSVRLRTTIRVLAGDLRARRDALALHSDMEHAKAHRFVVAQRSPVVRSADGSMPVPAIEGEEEHGDSLDRARADIGLFIEQHFGARLMPQIAGGAWDAAVWVDALPSPSFNPILVKYAPRAEHKDDLRNSLKDLHLLLALLVLDHAEPDWDVADGSVIVTVGVDRLAQLNKRQFARLMVKARDRLVRSQS
jgi:hypothetical protein